MKNTIIIFLALFSFGFFMYPTLTWTFNPEITAMEMFKSYWYCYLFSFVGIMILQHGFRGKSYHVVGKSGHGRTYGKKHFEEQRKRKEMEEALKFCQNKLYILVHTPNAMRDDLKIDARKAYDRCNQVLGEPKF